LDTNVEGLDSGNIGKRIRGMSPDLIGFSATTMMVKEALREANAIKEIYPDVPIVMGGQHASVAPEQVLSNPSVDFVIRGEGELACIELVKQSEKIGTKSDFSKILGLSYKKDGKIVHNPTATLVSNIDVLPYPAYHLLKNLNSYYSPRTRKKPMTTCITSRGCAFCCVFCSVHTVMGKAVWRGHSPQYVANLIEYLIERFGVKDLSIQDDSFTEDMNRAEAICDEIIHRKLYEKIGWRLPNGIRCDRVSKRLLVRMKRAGCYHISFGIESGNQRILDTNGKKLKIEDIRNAVTWAHEVGIEVSGSFMIGLLGDNGYTIRKTIDFAKSLPLDFASFNIAIPHLGTVFYEIVKKRGKLLMEDPCEFRYYAGESGAIFELGECTKELMVKMQKDAIWQFYFRPSYILRRIIRLRLYDIPFYLRGLRGVVDYLKDFGKC